MQPASKRVIQLALFAAWASAACGTWMQAARHEVATGTWGGEHILLQVSDKGAEVEFDCAHGQITQPMAVNQHGDFDVPGTFTAEHGGPVRRDEPASVNQARYSGHVEGDTLSLTVALEKDTLGPFSLTHGGRPILTKCR